MTMSRTMRFAPKEFYHLYNRGTEKRDIFLSQNDYERFLLLLYVCNQPDAANLQEQGKNLQELIKIKNKNSLIDIAAYCLMPNHVHILAYEKQENSISKFMQKITTGYTMYFNKKYERTGALFQGTFKASWANNDRYLVYLISYIHLNPIKLIEPDWKENGITNLKHAEKFLESYHYSSYPDHLGTKRVESAIINKNTLPKYFESSLDFKKNVVGWLTYQQKVKPLGVSSPNNI